MADENGSGPTLDGAAIRTFRLATPHISNGLVQQQFSIHTAVDEGLGAKNAIFHESERLAALTVMSFSASAQGKFKYIAGALLSASFPAWLNHLNDCEEKMARPNDEGARQPKSGTKTGERCPICQDEVLRQERIAPNGKKLGEQLVCSKRGCPWRGRA